MMTTTRGGRTRQPRHFLLLCFLVPVSKWIYPSTACTNLFICLSRVLHNYTVDSCFSSSCSYPDVKVPSQAAPLPFSTLIYTLISCVRRRLVSSTQVVFFYLNHNDTLTRLFPCAFSI